MRQWLNLLLRHAPPPLYEGVLLVLFMPPVITGIWWLRSKGLQGNLETGDDSTVAVWTEGLGKFLLIFLYVAALSFMVYTYWINPYRGPSNH